METQQIKDNSLKTLRKFMFEEMIALREGATTTQDAITMSKLANQVINSYKVEIEAVNSANSLKDKNSYLVSNITAI